MRTVFINVVLLFFVFSCGGGGGSDDELSSCEKIGDIKDEISTECKYDAVCDATGSRTKNWQECVGGVWVAKESIVNCNKNTDGVSCGDALICTDGVCVEGDSHCSENGAVRNEVKDSCIFSRVCDATKEQTSTFQECVDNNWADRSATIVCETINTDGKACKSTMVCKDEKCVEKVVLTDQDIDNDVVSNNPVILKLGDGYLQNKDQETKNNNTTFIKTVLI